MGVIGCTLEDIADLGISCGEVQGIMLGSGVCINDSDESLQCEGCTASDMSICKKYISEGVFKHEKCPKEYMCTTVKQGDGYDEDTNICILRQSALQKCSDDQVYVCYRGNSSTCESSCSFCDPSKYTCFRIVGTEEGGSECVNAARTCREGGSYFCVNGKWVFDSSCDDGCDAETGKCIKPQSPSTCSSDSRKCEDGSIYICQDGQWEFEKTCPISCVDGACSDVQDPENPVDPSGPETCEDGDVGCQDNVPLRCINGNWAEKSACEYGCENGSCKDAQGEIVVPPAPECVDQDRLCEDGKLKICSQGEWFSQACTYGCSEGVCLEIGESCSAASFRQTCIHENENALICQDGAITKIRCSEKNCAQDPNDPLRVDCTDKCSADSTRRCAPACGDNKTGYFWNNSGKVQSVSCKTHDCTVTDGYVNCGGIPCAKDSKERCVPSCSDDKKTGYWMSNSNNIHTISCPDADCISYKGTVMCGEPEYCTSEDYVPSCSAQQTSQGTYCSSDGIVKTYTCKNSFCKIKYDGTCEGGASCEGGRYSIYNYPKGYLDCVKDPNAVPDIPDTCKAGTSSALCIGQELYVCGSNNKYARIQTCSEDAPCTVQNGYGQCGRFEPCIYQKDHAKCVGQDLYVCGASGVYFKKETCMADKKCTVNANGYGQCGDFQKCTYKVSPAKCDGRDLYLCGSNNLYYKAETCALDKPCTVKNGYGQCGDIISCNDNSPARCENNDLYICKNNQYQKTKSCTDEEPCQVEPNSGFGYCGSIKTCKYGISSAECRGQDMYVCNKKNVYVKTQTCDIESKCYVTASGYGICLKNDNPGLCTRGTSSAICKEDVLYICDSYGYYKAKKCASDERCSVSSKGYGECLPASLNDSCVKGASAYCVNNKLYTCNASGGVYYMKEDCGEMTCDVNLKGYGQCVPSQTCTANKCQGRTMYICKDGKYYANSCDAGKECKLSLNGYAKCLPSQVPIACDGDSPAICVGKDMYLCNDKYATYDYFKTCGAAETCTVSSDGYGDCQKLPSDISGPCNGAKCSSIDHRAYYCNYDTHTYYYHKSGDCTGQNKCVVCDNGFGGCGIVCK